MCTLAVFFRMWPDWPLVVAANRDEHLARPSGPPDRSSLGALAHVAPRDLHAGGTWWGVNEVGLFVAITNRYRPRRDVAAQPGLDRPLRSRGLLVNDVLEATTAPHGYQLATSIDGLDYDGFHLLIADAASAFVVVHDRGIVQARRLEPGLAILTERSFGAAPTQREGALKARLVAFGDNGEPPSDERLRRILSLHGEPGTEGVCVHMPDRVYGTRSSTILRFGRNPNEARLLYADGPPCRTPFKERSDLLQGLLRDS